MHVSCVAQPSSNVSTRSCSRTGRKITSFGPKPVYPPMKEMESNEKLFTMYMARKAWHRIADDLFIEYFASLMLKPQQVTVVEVELMEKREPPQE